jgi:hypothetical protein
LIPIRTERGNKQIVGDQPFDLPYEQSSTLVGIPDGRMYLAIVNYKGHIVHMVERNELALEIANKLEVHRGPGSTRKNKRLQKAASEAVTDFFMALMRM